MKVALFATCIVDLFKGNVGKATVELLERLGCEIDFPESQVCCGQPAYNSGYVEETKKTMKTMIEAFENAQYVVSPSGSCVYFLKEYLNIFQGDGIWEERAKRLANKTYEVTHFIVDVLKVKDVGAKLDGVATYHPSCHMSRLYGIKEQPIELLKHVDGLQLVELPNKELCCGFGGTFSVKMHQISTQMVDEKVSDVIATNADYLIGADSACLMNIAGRLSRVNGKEVRVMHIVEVLNSK